MKPTLLLFFLPAMLLGQTGLDELVDVKELIPDIVVDLRYNTTRNFVSTLTGSPQKLYTTDVCLVSRAVIERLQIVQDTLRALNLGLKIFDAYRPRAVQYLMWELVPNPTYVADPNNGSNHNRGIAVDVTLVDRTTGQELAMPTEFDYFGPEAWQDYVDPNPQINQNKELLRSIMVTVGGFTEYSAEWWHYHYAPGLSYPLLDFQPK